MSVAEALPMFAGIALVGVASAMQSLAIQKLQRRIERLERDA